MVQKPNFLKKHNFSQIAKFNLTDPQGPKIFTLC